MKKKNINKVIALTLGFCMVFATVVSAKTTQKVSKSSYIAYSFDPHPSEPGGTK